MTQNGRDHYALVSSVLKRVADAQQALVGCPMTEVSWQSIAFDLKDALESAEEIMRRCKARQLGL